MVKSNGYTPTNKYFRNKFQDFASTKTKKGHLNHSDEEEGAKNLTGTLVKIDKDKLYTNGWLVETTDKKQYWCSYGDGVVCLPEYTESGKYYTPKTKTEVNISIDEDNKVYLLTRLKDPNKKPIAFYNDKLEISVNTNTDTNKKNNAKIEVSKNDVNIKGNTVVESFKANNIAIEDSLTTETIISLDTKSLNMTADTVKTEQIVLSDDEEPTMQMIASNVTFSRPILAPTIVGENFHGHEVKAHNVHAEEIHLGDEDLAGKLNNLERRIKRLEDDN